MEAATETSVIESTPTLASANRRIIARWLDALILGFFGGFILAVIWEILFGISDELADNQLFNVLMGFLGMMLLDAPCTKLWGRTPGKFLLGMKVVSTLNAPITWGQAWKRAVLLWVRGLCLGIPLLLLITAAVSMRKVAKSGVSSWDTLSCTQVIRNVSA
jgi:uncharacterized RDD family membrane protein YckC